jgi:hypothetical protein
MYWVAVYRVSRTDATGPYLGTASYDITLNCRPCGYFLGRDNICPCTSISKFRFEKDLLRYLTDIVQPS